MSSIRAVDVGQTRGGLGNGIAAALAESGAFVIVSGRDIDRGRGVVDHIESDGGAAAFTRADLGLDESEVSRLAAEATEAAGGSIDILINNAGAWSMRTPTADVHEAAIRDTFAVNVTLLTHC